MTNVVGIQSARTETDLFPEGATGRRAFSPRRMADEALRLFDVGRLAGDLRVYRDGAYRADDERLREFALDVLGDDFTPRRFADFAATLSMMAPALPDVPDPRLVVFDNCTVDATTGVQLVHSPEHRATVALPVAFDARAKCPNIVEFIGDVLDEAFHARAWEVVGHCMSSWNSLRAFAWLVGLPGQGKSTFADLIRALVGGENVAAVQPHQLADSPFAGAALVGKLVNLAPDVSAADLRSVSFLKSTTGDDLVTVERKFSQPVAAKIFAKHVFASNTLPTFSDVSGAISARVKVLEFERQTSRPDDPHLRGRLTTPDELSGLAVQGLRALYELRQRGSFTENDHTRRALASFRSSTNTIAAFVDECCTTGPDLKVRRSDLWRAFTEWADEGRKGARTSKTAFFATLRADHAVTETKVRGEFYMSRISLVCAPGSVAS